MWLTFNGAMFHSEICYCWVLTVVVPKLIFCALILKNCKCIITAVMVVSEHCDPLTAILFTVFLFHRNQKAGLQWARGLIIIIIICLCSWCRHRDSIVNDRVFYSARLVLPGQMLKKNDCPVSSRHLPSLPAVLITVGNKRRFTITQNLPHYRHPNPDPN